MTIGFSIIGNKYNLLTVVAEAPTHIQPNGKKRVMWECRCDCGNTTVARGDGLKSGGIKSCGCHKAKIKRLEKTTHGMSETLSYKRWRSMRQRCNNSNHPSYKNYGGKGITYDPAWENFEEFYKDMGECPAGLELDRINSNKDYCKSNCRWATNETQNQNTSRVRLNPDLVKYARQQRSIGRTWKSIANELLVSETCIRNACNYLTWKNVS